VTIEKAGKRAAAVVSDLLTLARNAASVKEPTDINLLITELLSSPEWKGLARQHPRVSLSVELTADEATVNCSQVHIRKCLINLLNNGLEACSPEGKVTIATLNAQHADCVSADSGSTTNSPGLIIRISDTGPGVDSKHLEHIFEPFYTTKKLGRSGSGLGLSVVWNAIEEHNGCIKVENLNPGAGFEIRLPVIASSEMVEPAKTKNDIQSYRGSGHILVVDDEPELLKITGGIVRMLGYTATAAASGEEALEFLQEQQFDLILLDMILKDGMSGYETYRKILEIRPEQKALIISGYATSEEVKMTLQLGASGIIQKPYTLDDLGYSIKKCLEKGDE
jgi:CheY-like chemotaxis protein